MAVTTLDLPETYRAWLRHGRARLVHPTEAEVRDAIRRVVDRTPNRQRPALIVLINAVQARYRDPRLPDPIVRQGWGPLTARVARQMGVR